MRGSLHTVGLLLALHVLSPMAARAAVVCYDESHYPAVVRVRKTETGVRVFPGIDEYGPHGDSPPPSVLLYTETGGWEPGQYTCKDWNDCNGSRGRDGFPGPTVSLSIADAIKLRPELAHTWLSAEGDFPPDAIEQNIVAWTEHDGALWFGLSFYDGEGTSGVGGIGRYDLKSKEVIVRRPPLLRDISVFQVAHDGNWLWLGAGGYYECLGQPPSHGLLRYDWKQDRMESFEGSDDGPCGFTIHDLLVDGKYLWVASDLGLSRRNRDTGKWQHFVPDPTAMPPMRETTCSDLYRSLLKTLPKEHEDWEESLYSQLFGSLQRFHPRFLAEYMKELPPAQRSCDELRTLTARAPDFAWFEENVVRPVRVGDPAIACALEVFAEKNPRDPQFRDLVLRVLEWPRFPRQSDLVPLLGPFAPDARIGDVLVKRLATEPEPGLELKFLPRMSGRASVAPLMQALGRFRGGDEFLQRWTIAALSEATGIALSADGTQTKIAGKEFDGCDVAPCRGRADEKQLVERVADQWLAWWPTHRQEFEAQAGSPAPSPLH